MTTLQDTQFRVAMKLLSFISLAFLLVLAIVFVSNFAYISIIRMYNDPVVKEELERQAQEKEAQKLEREAKEKAAEEERKKKNSHSSVGEERLITNQEVTGSIPVASISNTTDPVPQWTGWVAASFIAIVFAFLIIAIVCS